MRYPMILMGGFAVAILVLSTFVLPKFMSLLTPVGGKMPLPTAILMAFTNFMAKFWYVIVLLAAGIGATFGNDTRHFSMRHHLVAVSLDLLGADARPAQLGIKPDSCPCTGLAVDESHARQTQVSQPLNA